MSIATKVVGLLKSLYGLSGTGSSPLSISFDRIQGTGAELKIGGASISLADSGGNTFATFTSANIMLSPALVVLGGSVSGAATTAQTRLFKKTGIADNSATSVIRVTVPNGNHAAALKLLLVSSNGSTDAFESTRCAEGLVVLARTTGVTCVATATALANAGIATVAAGATHTLAYAVTAMTGAAGASQTFDVTVTIDDSGNLGSNQLVCLATMLNAESSGVTFAAV